MTEHDFYDRVEELLHEVTASHWDQVVSSSIDSYLKMFPRSRSEKEIKEILNGLIRKLEGFPPPWLLIIGPDGEIDTPDDIWIEPAYNEIEIEKAWNLHDGRNLGTMVVGVYRWSPDSMSWHRDTTYGILGDTRKTRKADPDDPDDSLCSK
jgi:hypothetical protein